MQFFSGPKRTSTSRISYFFTVACALLVSSAIALPLSTTTADAKKRASKKTKIVLAKPKGPLTIVISLGRQRVTVYDGTRVVDKAPISSGSPGRRTPTGLFTILQKHRHHFSNLYNSAPMPNMQRITWSGVAMHAGHLPGYPASHGCIRLPYSFSKRLFGITELGNRVVVAQSQPVPRPIRHTNLFKPLPKGDATIAPQPVRATNPGREASNAARMLLGVTPAHAAQSPTTTPVKPTGAALTRASLKAFRDQELLAFEFNAKDTLVERKRAAAALKAANLEVSSAHKTLTIAKTAATELSTTISTATRDSYKASRQMQVFIEKSRYLETPLDVAKAAQREEALEAELLAQDTERDMAREERADLSPVIAGHAETLSEKKDRRKTLLRESTIASKRHSDALKALNQARQAIKRRDQPVTILVSRKTMKLYVRQGYDPVFTAPIEIEQPDAPLGTQFYSAYAYSNDGDELVWHSLTAERRDVRKKRSRRSRKKRRRNAEQDVVIATPGRPAQTARNALERIKVSNDVKARLAELIKPGSALYISDRGVGNETGEFTSIIVQTR